MPSEKELQKLIDFQAICRLKALYCEIIDRYIPGNQPEDAAKLAEIWTEDAELDFTNMGLGVTRGRAAIVELFAKTLPITTSFSWHSIHSPIIDIDVDKALGRWTISALTTRTSAPNGQTFGTFGRYRDEYRRENGVWRQSKLYFDAVRVGQQVPYMPKKSIAA